MILQAKHLTKRYGDYMAVDDIQLKKGDLMLFWVPMVQENQPPFPC